MKKLTLFAIGGLLFACVTCLEAESIRSQPLPELGGKSLILAMPTGIKIKSRDDATNWRYVEYDFTVASKSIEQPLRCAVLQYPLSRAERKAFCNGTLVRINPGIRAWFSQFDFKGFGPAPVVPSLATYHVMCIPVNHESAIVIECIADTKENAAWEPAIQKIYHSVTIR